MDNKIPIVIGFSGHRDLREQDITQLKDKLREAFTQIKSLCGPDTPLILLNSLAEGADQLCCKIAEEFAIPIIAVLPRSKESYQEDFNGEALDEFNLLCSKAQKVIVTNDIEGRNLTNVDYGYRQASIYVALHSHILIALWNGQEPTINGCGTAEAVSFALKHTYINPNGTQFNAPNDAIVLWITTPRKRNPNNIEKIEIKYLTSKGTYTEMPKQIKDICKITNDFNSEEIDTSKGWPLIDKDVLDNCCPVQKKLHECYLKANKASTKYRDKFKNRLKWLAVLSVLVVLFFTAYDEAESNLFMPLCFLALLVSVFIYIFASPKHGDYHRKFIEYRAMAETLRTQFYVSCCGLNDCVCDYFTWSQKNEIVWIKEAVSAILVGDNTVCSNLDKVKQNWIGAHGKDGYDGCGQLGYHRNKIKKEKKNLEKTERITKTVIVITAVLYCIILILEVFFQNVMAFELPINNEVIRSILFMHDGQSILVRGLFKISISIMASVSVFLSNYYGKMSISRVYSDSSKMAILYADALDKWEDDNIKREDLIRELAREEVTENGVWLSYYKDNDISINL